MSTRGRSVMPSTRKGVSVVCLRDGTAVENHLVVGVGVTEETQLVGLEGLDAQGVGLVDLAGAVDLVVEHGENTHTGGFGSGSDAHGVQEVQVGVGADRGGRPHRASDDNGAFGLDGEVQEVGRLLQGGGAVGDDDAGRVGLVAVDGVDALGEGDPVCRANGGAADADHILGDNVEVLADLGHTGQVLVDGEVVADFGVTDVVHPVRSDAGDAAAGGDDVDGGIGHGGLLWSCRRAPRCW